MKKLIVALLATGLIGSAFAQTAPQQTPPPAPVTTPAPTPSIPGARRATGESRGDLKPFYIVAGVAAVAAIAVAAGSSGGKSSGTTGTH